MDNVVLEKLKLANAKLKEFDSYKSEPIAIVGMGSRFPGNSADLDSYWDLLANGRSGIGRVPDDRWSVQEFEGDELYQPGKIVSDRGGFVPHLKDFDERVFEIAPIEAKYLDPQHRLLLEVSWETFENAQFDIGSINQTALGIYLGISNSDYAYTLFDSDYDELNPYFSTGNSHSTAAGRLSHFYGSKGPCVSLDTACSSSLVGIHYAVQALRTRECDVALAGGVNRILSPIVSICFSQAHMLSPDGECKTFDEAANGYVRGEGCGMVLLKRMSDAVKENRPILGIIRGSAINHDGRSSGLTVPNGPSQQQLVRDALKNAKLSPDDISYIEAHGTGTELGDPIELGALGAVFSDGRSEQEPLRVGSVKTNIGHLEPAAGIAGFIKTVLALQHKTIPPHLNFSRPNPHVDWSELGIKIPQQSEPWQPRNGRRIAGVSSFGFSGTNAHVIVEEAPERAEVVGRSKRNAHLLTLSAKSGEALEGLRKAYIDFLQNSPADAGSICHHAGAGRSDFAYRIAVTGEDKDALRQQLQKLTPADFSAPVMQANRIAVLFTGQGSQYLGMGKVLYDSNKYFRHQIDHCAELLTPTLSRPLTEILWGDAEALIDDTRYTQVALFALEYSLFRWWEYQGLKPHYVMGHSVGEYVAACVAGVFSLEDGLRLMEARGRLMAERAEAGGMLAVLADGKRVEELLAQQGDRKLSIAAYNGPRNTVVAGCPEALQRFGQTLEQQAIAQVPLVVSHGFHSPQMAPVLDAFREVAESVTYHRPQLGLVSNVSGAVDNECWTQADYWVTHIMAPVKYAQSVTALLSVGVSCFVEVGPHPVLTALGRQISREGCWLSTLQRGRDDWDSLTESLGTLYRQGHALSWQHLDEDNQAAWVQLPNYVYHRTEQWQSFASKRSGGRRTPNENSSTTLLGAHVPIPEQDSLRFSAVLTSRDLQWIEHHRVHNHAILPGTAFVDMAAALSSRIFPASECSIKRLTIQKPLIYAGQDIHLHTLVTEEDGKRLFRIFSRQSEDESWIEQAQGELVQSREAAWARPLSNKPESDDIDPAWYYESIREKGIDYQNEFQGIERLYKTASGAVAHVQVPPDALRSNLTFSIHPVVLDACLHVLGATYPEAAREHVYIPFEFADVHFDRALPERVICEAVTVESGSDHLLKGRVLIFDESENQIGYINQIVLMKTDSNQLKNIWSEKLKDSLYELTWQTDGQWQPGLPENMLGGFK